MSDMTRDHVRDEMIAAYLDRTMMANDRQRFEDHLATCTSCRTTVLEAARIVGSTRRRRRRVVGLGVAAAAALSAILIVPRSDSAAPDTVRSRTAENPSIQVLQEWTGNVNEPGTFVWRAIDHTLRYHFELVTASGRLVWDTTIRDTTVTVPNAVRQESDALLWSVDALMDDGSSSTTGYRPIDSR